MVQSAVATPTLWTNTLFFGGFLVLSAVTLFGVWSFFQHWKARVIGPAFIAVAYGLVTFDQRATYVLVTLMLAFVIIAYFVSPDRVAPIRNEQSPAGSPTDTVIQQRDEAERQRNDAQRQCDSAQRELTEARHQIAELEAHLAFPEFVMTIQDIQEGDPAPSSNRVLAVLILGIGNSGAKSVARNYRVSGQSVSGFKLNIDVLHPPAFTLALNRGRDCIDYTPDDYIINRTHSTPVERGVPVTGVLPCHFSGIANLKEVDFRTLKVSFIDGTGDADGKPKEWESSKITEINYSEIVPHESRPGLPRMRPCR
jgi:hypothetical protein